jgi:phosphoribosylaminoimidazolecarboxamide formyltransferase/IMP cyclohydrolase
MRAILSVSDKSGLIELAKGLIKLDTEIFSTGGTKKVLSEAGLPVKSISEITGFPEILDGRVKTLHPMVHGGILARRDKPEHIAELKENNIQPIDIVVVNLYPFVQTVSGANVNLVTALENIDIGGPTMIRAAAKNFLNVIVTVDPDDYTSILEKIGKGNLTLKTRRQLAQKAFQHVAIYDTAISQYLRSNQEFPDNLTIALRKRYDLRYGENPHQKAAFYNEQSINSSQDTGITWAEQLWGKELSFNNILDADAAWSTVTDFSEPTVTIVKHTNSCGLASNENIAEAYRRAFSGDAVSAFGGIVASNRIVTTDMADEMSSVFYEIVVAPDYQPEALENLKNKKNLRVLKAKLPPYVDAPTKYWDYRRVRGGLLIQESDSLAEGFLRLKTVTRREPTDEELADLLFAWRVVKHIKSNAIVLAKNKMVVGMGAGQPNRVTSVQIAANRAGDRSQGSVMASDAMFPFPDSVEQASQYGVKAIIQPGGSLRDNDSIESANKFDIAMVFTGTRHFLH